MSFLGSKIVFDIKIIAYAIFIQRIDFEKFRIENFTVIFDEGSMSAHNMPA